MTIEQQGWTRAPDFKKYLATSFGITKSGNLYRIDIGNERVKISEKEIFNVSECQIIMDGEAFDALLNLMKNTKKKKK